MDRLTDADIVLFSSVQRYPDQLSDQRCSKADWCEEEGTNERARPEMRMLMISTTGQRGCL